MEYSNELSGALFKEDPEKLKENPKRPFMTGSVEVNEEKLRVASWKKADDEGPFYSLAISGEGFVDRGRGLLRPTETDNDRAPKFAGDVEIDDYVYDVKAWVRQKKSDNEDFLSLKLVDPAVDEVTVDDEEIDPDGSLDF